MGEQMPQPKDELDQKYEEIATKERQLIIEGKYEELHEYRMKRYDTLEEKVKSIKEEMKELKEKLNAKE